MVFLPFSGYVFSLADSAACFTAHIKPDFSLHVGADALSPEHAYSGLTFKVSTRKIQYNILFMAINIRFLTSPGKV